MAVVDSRVKNGILTLTSGTGQGVSTGQAFSCQITSVAINPSTTGGDDAGQEVLCGDVLAGSAGTTQDTLDFTYIADWSAATGSLAAFLWMHRGETVKWDVQFDNNALDAWSGTAGPLPATQIGGAVNEQVTIDISLPILTVEPPVRFGDGSLKTGGYKNPVPGQAGPGEVFQGQKYKSITGIPGDIAELGTLGFVAKPSTAWTAGQKIDVGVAGALFPFHWDGTIWATGAAA